MSSKTKIGNKRKSNTIDLYFANGAAKTKKIDQEKSEENTAYSNIKNNEKDLGLLVENKVRTCYYHYDLNEVNLIYRNNKFFI